MNLSRIIQSFIFLLLISLSVTLDAQQAKKIKPEEAVRLAIENSNQLKSSSARIQEAEAVVREARDMRLPSASVSGSHIRLNSPNVDLKLKQSSNGGNGPSGKISSATYGIASATLPIYSGSSVKYAIGSAKYLAEAARLDGSNDREAIIINTIDAFNNLYKAKAAVELVKENLESARERVKQFLSFERNGILARNDLLKAELQASNTELSLLDAENNLKLANIHMDLMLGLPDSTQIEPEINSFSTPDQLMSMDDMIQSALQHRNDKASLEQRKKAAGTDVKYARSGKYPSLSLTAGYIALDVPNLLTVTNAVNVGIGVQYNLSSLWKNNAKVQKAQAREQQIAANEAMLNDNIKEEVQEAYFNYLLMKKKIDTYRQAVAQAEENYKIVKNKYDNSLATTTDLLDADIAQLQVKLDFAFSQADASTAYSKLLKSAGLLNTTLNIKE